MKGTIICNDESRPMGGYADTLEERTDNERPIVETYNEGLVPDDIDGQSGDGKADGSDADGSDGKKTVIVGEYITMTKVLFEKFRLEMYTFLNRELRNDRLKYFAGFRPAEKSINHEICEFGAVTYWYKNREEFMADVEVELDLTDRCGFSKRCKGYMSLLIEVYDEWDCAVEDLTVEMPDRTGCTMLSPFLIPYFKSHDIDVITEKIWQKYMPEALCDSKVRSARALAEEMGLRTEYHPLYEDGDIESILFFKEGLLYTEEESDTEDESRRSACGRKKGEIVIPAGTIVINSRKVQYDYSYFNIYHECFHNEIHYLFFRLQEMGNNDARQVKTKKIT
nr:hypothetical protein [Lachnospiraceae bacterium]